MPPSRWRVGKQFAQTVIYHKAAGKQSFCRYGKGGVPCPAGTDNLERTTAPDCPNQSTDSVKRRLQQLSFPPKPVVILAWVAGRRAGACGDGARPVAPAKSFKASTLRPRLPPRARR